MDSYHDMLAERRAATKAAGMALATKARAERRDLNTSEQAQFDQIVADLHSQDEALARLNARSSDASAADDVMRALAGKPIENRAGVKSPEQRAIDDKFRSAVLENNPAPIVLRDPAARSNFQPGIEARALASNGGSLSGTTFFGVLMAAMTETSAVLRAGARVMTTETGEPMLVPRQTAFGAASIVPEGQIIPESDPAQSTVKLGAFKYAKLVTVSNELVNDAGFDLSGYLAYEAGVSLGNALGNDLINGVGGSTAPRGVLLDATLGVTAPTGCTTSLGSQSTAGQGTDLLNALVASVAEPYAQSSSAAFLTRNGVRNATIANLKGSTGDLVGNQWLASAPAPVLVDPFVPTMAANAKSILFGDWSRVTVRIVNGIRFERSYEAAFNSDQTVFRAILRADGALVDTTGAIKYLQNSAT